LIEKCGKWVRFVFLYSFIPVFLLWADPAHAKRHGQGTHSFFLLKAILRVAFGRDFSPASLLIIRTIAERVKGKLRKKSEF
jgi:hypothetical protein